VTAVATIPAAGASFAPGPPGRGVEALASRLGHEFEDLDRLALAVTHRSFCAENSGYVSNERLEFLGDAVLSIVVTDHIFAAYAEMPEGELAKVRASVVSAVTLAEVAGELQLGDAVRLGKGEDASGGRLKASILADAMEAVFGAVYIDGGIDAVRPLILGLLGDRIASAAIGPGGHDYKTQLQELAARSLEQLPVYELRDEGPDHEKRFFATVLLDGVAHGAGEGRSKKQAEQSAAHAALLALANGIEGIEGVETIETIERIEGTGIHTSEGTTGMQVGNVAGAGPSVPDGSDNDESEGPNA
jgi:ribonuclease III